MVRSTVYVVSEESDVVEKAKSYFQSVGVNVQCYNNAQWKEHLDSMIPKAQPNVSALPNLSFGNSPLEKNNVLPFPSPSANGMGDSRVATIDELESKAIENAILKSGDFKGFEELAQISGQQYEKSMLYDYHMAMYYEKTKDIKNAKV